MSTDDLVEIQQLLARYAVTITQGDIDGLLAVYSIPRISQVQLIYRAHLSAPEFAAGAESLEVKLFAWDEIPWDEIAFPSVRWALDHYRESAASGNFTARGTPG